MSRKTHMLRDRCALDRVRCLECGTIYAKPVGGGTVQENPGCPKCGYLGWITEPLDVAASVPRHSGAGHLPQRPVRLH